MSGIESDGNEITCLLEAAGRGESSAAERLLPLVYERLRALAASYLAQDRPGHTLQPTALVHEAYLKLVGSENIQWEGRSHFFSVAAKAMRQILMNHARDRRAFKRGGLGERVTLHDAQASSSDIDVDLERLDGALTELERVDPRQSRVVELRFFGGMTIEDTAAVMGLSERTIQLEWRMAKARLKTYLDGANPS
ncbi:MAG: sigma-70 family RNA polymerase sigma factor [Phycisphaerae bacterium]|nr:sigma-70 family RNA polymerase sigma factor [Phycisphaerae bacterium]